MCDKHRFEFDVDKAYAEQLVATLETSPAHPLESPEAPQTIGVYVLYRSGEQQPVYIGEALGASGIRGRWGDHLKKVSNRVGIAVDEMACRYLVLRRRWEVARGEEALIAHYQPPWNGIPGFSMHVPGRGRPGMPDYTNEWDQMFPPR